MSLTRSQRIGILAVLAALTLAGRPASATDMDACFDACYVMEVGCNSLKGTLVGSCYFNSGAAPDMQCRLPGCVCTENLNGVCAPREPLMYD